jgi:phospholipase/carboxylesterase
LVRAGGPIAASPLVILLHGRGAEAKTIFSIEGMLDPRYHVLAITGPYDSAIEGTAASPIRRRGLGGPIAGDPIHGTRAGGPTNGTREWFRPREKVPGEIHDAEQFEESERILTSDIEAHIARLKLDKSPVFLWGFSQGAAMAMIVGLRGSIRPRGVVSMAGFLPTPVTRWQAWDADQSCVRTTSKFLLAHGTNDEVLSPQSSLRAKEFLESKGIAVEYHEYRARHKMTRDSIAFIDGWIKKLARLPIKSPRQVA